MGTAIVTCPVLLLVPLIVARSTLSTVQVVSKAPVAQPAGVAASVSFTEVAGFIASGDSAVTTHSPEARGVVASTPTARAVQLPTPTATGVMPLVVLLNFVAS